ncbi:hypothetical protein, partial [Helicobacter typhlonius]|uniref:hypothetical protein n=1 Tax=Helicobacter typhlonius TaxID=76936 RepID=UPI002FDF4CA1
QKLYKCYFFTNILNYILYFHFLQILMLCGFGLTKQIESESTKYILLLAGHLSNIVLAQMPRLAYKSHKMQKIF